MFFSFGLVLLELITRKKIGTDILREKDYALRPSEIRSNGFVPPTCPELLLKLVFICCTYKDTLRPSFDLILEMIKQIQNPEIIKTTERDLISEFENNLKLTSSSSSGTIDVTVNQGDDTSANRNGGVLKRNEEVRPDMGKSNGAMGSFNTMKVKPVPHPGGSVNGRTNEDFKAVRGRRKKNKK